MTAASGSNVWEVDARLLDIRVGEPGELSYRPRLLLVLDTTADLILFGEIFHPQTPLADMVSEMVQRLPQQWPNAAPGRLRVRDAGLAALLSRVYPSPATTVKVIDRLPALDRVVAEMQASMGEAGGSHSDYWEDLASSYPDLAGLMQDAGAYYQARPWQFLRDDDIVEMTVDSTSRYLSVMGGGGETYGLAVFLSEQGLRRLLRRAGGPDAITDAVGVVFDGGADFGPAVRKRIRERFPIAGRRAFPTFMRVRDGEVDPPSLDELDLLRMALQTLPQLLAQWQGQAGAGLVPVDLVTKVGLSTGTVQVRLRYPVPLRRLGKQ